MKIVTNKMAKKIDIIKKIAYLLPSTIVLSLDYTLINPYYINGN